MRPLRPKRKTIPPLVPVFPGSGALGFRPCLKIGNMRKTLEELFYGNLTPNEQQITPDSPLQQAMDQAEEYEEKLSALLEGEEKTMLLRLLNAENEIGSTLALENFILGFRLGMRVAIEALDEDDGSLTALPEGW